MRWCLDSFRGQVIRRPDNLRFNRQPGSFGKFECIAGGLGVFGGSLSRLCRLIPLKLGVVGIQANDADGENANNDVYPYGHPITPHMNFKWALALSYVSWFLGICRLESDSGIYKPLIGSKA